MSALPEYIYFEKDPAQRLQELITEMKPDHLAVLVDDNTEKHCLPLLKLQNATVIQIPAGERHKNLHTCEQIWHHMTEAGMGRSSILINIGGGVIGDMGGFAAATFKRGIRFINIPTTLLSQVDASIGGKLGVDFNGLKNHIGVFRDPNAVILSDIFLKTLDFRQLRSGFAEVIKHGLIWDQEYYKKNQQSPFPEKVDWTYLLRRSVEIKGEVVQEDPLEKGLRKILNFGHTLGHAVETFHLENGMDILHGEAIAIGMIMEMHLSHQLEWIDEDTLESFTSWIADLYGKMDTVPGIDHLYPLMTQDKKNSGNAINFSLIDRIGSCRYDVQVEEQAIENAIAYYRNL